MTQRGVAQLLGEQLRLDVHGAGVSVLTSYVRNKHGERVNEVERRRLDAA